ncbi:MAG: hypothetical protein HY052_05735 [Proteobacteria bacterium]|nr:hypothetical protein [Pseudomonadota bacterium]
MGQKTKLHQQIELETGLNIEKVDSQHRLNDYLDQGLAQLYRDVFTEPPYFESYSLEEVKACFQDYFKEGGYIFVVTDPQKENKPVAFLVGVPLKTHFDLVSKSSGYADPEKTIYVADAGVDPDYRRRNISVKMKKLLFEASSAAGFKQALSRTSQESYKQVSAFNKMGGKVLSGTFQDVAAKGLNGTIVTDTRVFYVYTLAQQAQDAANVTVLDRAIITRANGKDTAILPDTIPEHERDRLSVRIKTAYSGVDNVSFADLQQAKDSTTEQIVFDGKMYLMQDPGPAGNKGELKP